MVKEVRPKLTITELRLILKGLSEAGYDTALAESPEYRIYQRISALIKGQHKKRGRIWEIPK
ncbi:MAG: hypothetical protein OEZ29_01455 [Candidatus Bathyarchaeota archaeon]|nr:hypothetical protein [Candidatus Bathyarchaeota archaeon]MDH5779243.1 hypothetical protein [Candidatus Bathyarchaeota archaeon]